MPEIVNEVLEDVGYSPEGIQIDVFLHQQSPDIAEAVDHSKEQRAGVSGEQDGQKEGAGDQGVMVGFHALRHTYTSNLLANGAQPKDVQELLGHSDISITMNVYAHADREAKRNSAKLLDKVVGND